MKVFWVLRWDAYYPLPDNFISSFTTTEEAEEYIRMYKKENYIEDDDFQTTYLEVIDISNRL